MAPEVHMESPYLFGVDFWSAGVVLFWMLTGTVGLLLCWRLVESDIFLFRFLTATVL